MPWTYAERARVLREMGEDLSPSEWSKRMGISRQRVAREQTHGTDYKTGGPQMPREARIHLLKCRNTTVHEMRSLASVSESTAYHDRTAALPEVQERVAEARALLGDRSQCAFARHIGKSTSTVANWFSGVVAFPPSYLRQLREWDTLEDKAR